MVFNCLNVNLYFSRASLGLDNEPGPNAEPKYLKEEKPASRASVTPAPAPHHVCHRLSAGVQSSPRATRFSRKGPPKVFQNPREREAMWL